MRRCQQLLCLWFSFSLGAAYGRAEKEIRKFVLKNNLPFLPTPMGKGVIPDDHPQCVAAARSRCVVEVRTKCNFLQHYWSM